MIFAHRMQATLVVLMLGAPLIVAPAQAMETRLDPETQRIRVIWGRIPSSSYSFALEDPRIEIQASLPYLTYEKTMSDLQYARRLARIYLPRTYASLLASLDLIVLEDIDSRIFPQENLFWFRDAVREEGLGMIMSGGSQGFGGNQPFTSWGDTVLDDILPVQCYYDQRLSKDYLVRLKVVEPANELARSIPWEEAPRYYPPNFITPREGCQLLIVSDDDKKTPIYFYWDIGKGRFVGAQNMQGAFSMDFNLWRYYQDASLNTVYYAVCFPLPTDLVAVHRLREAWHVMALRESLLLAFLEFADRFGARVGQVEGELRGVDVIRKSSDSLYLVQDYPGALEGVENAVAELLRLERLAVKLKERALLWIYMIEWLTILSTFLLSGFLLWTLMVRRAVYKEVGLTAADTG